MSTITPVPIVPKVRTFAADLSEVRDKRGLVPPTPKQSPIAKSLPQKPKTVAPTKPVVAFHTSATAAVKVGAPIAPLPESHVFAQPVPEAVIPPFHTLTKTANAVAKTIDTSEFTATTKQVKPSVLANPGEEPLAVNSRDNSGDGTIITDTKRKRFSLFGAIGDSIREWMVNRKQSALRRKIPTYTVPEADRRKGVIQKATTQTGRTSTADHAAALGRIKSSQKTVRRSVTSTVPTPVVVVTPTAHKFLASEPFAENIPDVFVPIIESPAEPVAVPKPQVRPQITPTIPQNIAPAVVLEDISSHADNTPVTRTTRTIAEKLQELEQRTADAAVLIPKSEARNVATLQPVVTPIERPRITPIIPTTTAPESIITDAPAPQIKLVDKVTPELQPVSRPNWSAALTQSAVASSTVFTRNAAALRTLFTRTNHVALAVAGGISVIVIGWYGIQAVLTLRTSPNVPATARSYTFLTNSTSVATTTLITSKDGLIKTLHTFDTSNDSFTEVAITNPTTRALMSPAELFTLLNARVNTSFIAAVDKIGLGSYRGTPWLILNSSDAAGIQGGMLAWENNIDGDLSPWFSTTTLRTTKNGITLFHDDTILGKDVRILSDNNGRDRVVYGFITSNQLLITNNTTTFLNLANQGTTGQ